jgi:hypothetical protein
MLALTGELTTVKVAAANVVMMVFLRYEPMCFHSMFLFIVVSVSTVIE